MTRCPHCGKSLEVKQITGIIGLSEVEEWFCREFWPLFPRKVGKYAALKAWKKAATSENSKDAIMAGLKAQLPRMQSLSKEFIPHASTWLNGRRWEDERPASSERPANVQRKIACQLCGDAGTISSFPDADTMALAACSCARGALPGLMVGVYRVSTGERLGDAPVQCSLCADTGIMRASECIIAGLRVDARLERCSCARGQLPGLVIPQAEETPF
jgi:hypothetical protein